MRARRALSVALTGATATAWAAFPTGEAGGWGVLLLVLASLAVAGGVARVAVLDGRRPDALLPGPVQRLEEMGRQLAQQPPWEVAACVDLVVLEVLHQSRPWHTAVLAVLIFCYLLMVQLAELIAAKGALRGQARMSGVGLGLVVLVTIITVLPSGGGGSPADWLAVIGAVAAIVVAAMVLPI